MENYGNDMPHKKKGNNNESANNNSQENQRRTTVINAAEIKRLPLRTIRAGSEIYRAYYDEANLYVYFVDSSGNITGKRSKLKQPLPVRDVPLENPNQSYDDENDESSTRERLEKIQKTVQTGMKKSVDKAAEELEKRKTALSKEVKKPKKEKKPKEEGKKGKGKTIVIIILILIIILGGLGAFGYIKFNNYISSIKQVNNTPIVPKEGEIMVIEVKNDIIPGYEITEDNLQARNIDSKTYNQIAINGNDLYRWEQKDNILGMYATEYISAGHYVTTNSVTKVYKPPTNPWGMNNDNLGFADIPIDISSFDRTKLVIGAKVNIRFQTEQKEDTASESLTSVITGLNVTQNKSIVTTDSYTVNNATIANILTASDTNLFEYYSSLIQIPEGNQERFLKQSSKLNKEYISSITPAKLRIYMDKTYAEALKKSISGNIKVDVELTGDTDVSSTEKKEFFDNQTILMGNIAALLK